MLLILAFEDRTNDINSNFSSKFVDQDLKKLKSKMEINQNNERKYVLSHNFNNSLFDSTFPEKIKEADITPIYKREDKYLKETYPPVSVPPNVPKVYERLMCDLINTHFETTSNIPCRFRKGYSAQHCLIVP